MKVFVFNNLLTFVFNGCKQSWLSALWLVEVLRLSVITLLLLTGLDYRLSEKFYCENVFLRKFFKQKLHYNYTIWCLNYLQLCRCLNYWFVIVTGLLRYVFCSKAWGSSFVICMLSKNVILYNKTLNINVVCLVIIREHTRPWSFMYEPQPADY